MMDKRMFLDVPYIKNKVFFKDEKILIYRPS